VVDRGYASRLAKTPGTASAASGMAAKLSTIPMIATEPRAAAVIGAVARVAPTDDPNVRHHIRVPRALSDQRVKVVAPHKAATDSQPPRSTMAQGSTRSTQRQVAASSELGSTRRCLTRLTATSTASAAARVAGAGQPRNATYAMLTMAATL
jgi:hypothetical protein